MYTPLVIYDILSSKMVLRTLNRLTLTVSDMARPCQGFSDGDVVKGV